jgi:uncharacterized protein YfaP (DUF2135 family)
MSGMLRRFMVLSLAICASSQLGCSRDSSEADSPFSPSAVQRLAVENIATSASAGGSEGVRRPGTAPAPGGGPRIAATGNQRVINGGTQTVTITGDRAFDRVYVAVGGRTLGLVGEADGGVEGYYEIRLPGAQISAMVLLTFPQEISLTEFDLQFAVVDSAGAVGPYVGLATAVTSVGTGDVQVTLSWDADSDVDLHVVAPGGDEIFYGRRVSASGGELDLDSNAGCQIDGIRNENITWPVGRAPRGEYTVRVDYWNNCGVSRTNYTVRINNGGSVQIVAGSFTGAGDQGGLGSGRTIATFSRSSGPAAVVPTQPLSVGTTPLPSTTNSKSLGTRR